MGYKEIFHATFLFFSLYTGTLAAPPVVDPSASSYVTLSEAVPIGTPIKTVNVTDADLDDNIIVSVTDPSTIEYVTVNQSTGHTIQISLFLKKQLDRDHGTTSMTLKFVITDSQGNQVPVKFTLYITDVNDEKPSFVNEPYTLEIPENNHTGVVYSRISATDLDEGYAGYVTYGMEPKSQSDTTADEYNRTFSINNQTGKVSLLEPLDFEKNSYYQFTVIAQDMAPPYNNVSTLLIIRVLDVQDKAPFFTGIPYRTTIQEGVPIGSTVITVSATDGDPSVSNQVAFTIEDGDCSSFFNVSAGGVLTTTKIISRDEGEIKKKSGVCSFPVKAYEINGTEPQYGNTTTTTNITVIIEDVNNHVPMFVNNTKVFKAEIQENSPNEVPIKLINPVSMQVQDNDQGDNSKMAINLTTSDFTITPDTVQDHGSLMILVANRSVLDYETRQNITFQTNGMTDFDIVIVTEEANTNHSTTATVLLDLIDMNDNNPLFENTSYTFYIDENSDNGTEVGTIKATDRDSGKFGNISFSLSGGSDKFIIGLKDGIIRTNADNKSLDREELAVYYLTITATDGGDRSNATSVVIHLNDMNDNAPEFQRDEYIAYISEKDTKYNVTPVIVVEARDADETNTNNSEVRYSLKTVLETAVQLKINATSGEVFLEQPVDFETLENKTGVPEEVKVIIEATDCGNPNRSNDVNLTLHVQDENDNAPRFNQSIYVANVLENATSTISNHTVIVQVSATDADKTSRNSDLDYFIISGSLDKFSIDSSTGYMYVKPSAELDRENVDFYSIIVYAIDHGSPPLTGTTMVNVTVLDVNDVSPRFNHSSYNVTVKENQNSSNAVTCFAYDVDEDHSLYFNITHVTATNESGNNVESLLVADFFSIDSSTGSVSVFSTADREIADLIKLEITVYDLNAYRPYPQTATATLTVRLQDVNDNPPEFENTNYTFTVSENAQNPSIIATLQAQDKDVNRTITYSLGPEPMSFTIDSQTGVLKKVGPLDRESNATVDIVVIATDSGVPPLSNNVSVHISVSDFNDNAPEFEPHKDAYNVQENAKAGYVIAVINATDKDIGKNSNISYSIKDGAFGNFTINETTGIVSIVNNLDRERRDSYTLVIEAKDNPSKKSEKKTTQTTITVNVIDFNDNAPKFNPCEYNTSVKENVNINTLVYTVTATDADQANTNDSRISYEMETTSIKLFKIDKSSGKIKVNSTLRGHVGNYTLSIIAKDNGDPQLNGTAVVHVEVTDVNLNKPKLIAKPSGNLVKTYECARLNSTVHQFNATDDDHGRNAELNYAISQTEGNATVTLFWIDSANGVLKTKEELTNLGGQIHKLQLIVSDKGDPVLSSDPYVFDVEILDVNDHPPEFRTVKNMSVAEKQINKKVGEVAAFDQDRNSVSCYSITASQWSEYFSIGNTSGILTTSKKLDRENITTTTDIVAIPLTITVSDCSKPENISKVCDNYTGSSDSSKQTADVYITILDVDDNPPVFTQHEISYGMRRTVKPGNFLNLQLRDGNYVTDKDTPANAKEKWIFRNNGTIIPSEKLSTIGEGINPCDDTIKHVFCVSKNGSILNNKWFGEDTSGFFIVPVSVGDGAGDDTAMIKIYLIADSQVLVMTIFGRKAEVVNQQEEILQLFSNITKHRFVYDDIADHRINEETVDTLKTDLFFHVVEPGTNRILPAPEAQKLVDKFAASLKFVRETYKITSIVTSIRPTEEQTNNIKTIYILVAVIVILTLSLGIIIYLSCSTASRYRRKLKAATISTVDKDLEMKETAFVPGSNQYSKQANPLLNAEEPQLPQYDQISLSSENSLDANEVDGPRPDALYDRLEEKEMTLDMYNDDEFIPIKEEDPLAAALRLHELRRSAENLDKPFDSEESEPKVNGHVASQDKVIIHGYVNEAFDNLEHSEI